MHIPVSHLQAHARKPQHATKRAVSVAPLPMYPTASKGALMSDEVWCCLRPRVHLTSIRSSFATGFAWLTRIFRVSTCFDESTPMVTDICIGLEESSLPRDPLTRPETTEAIPLCSSQAAIAAACGANGSEAGSAGRQTTPACRPTQAASTSSLRSNEHAPRPAKPI